MRFNIVGLSLLILAACSAPKTGPPLVSGQSSYNAFNEWRKTSGSGGDWDRSVRLYREKLSADGLDAAAVDRALRAIDAYGEAELYDRVYTEPATFNTKPNQLLVDAVSGRPPGAALDIAMGQGRNSIYLAGQGWRVTGFDVAKAGLRVAERVAQERSLPLTAIHSSDEDFDFSEQRWDLIAMIYAMEKRSLLRIRAALKPGGLVVVEAGHKSASGAPFEYESGELLKIFEGFKIIRYEEPIAAPDWSHRPIRLVRLIAEKSR
ncbi:MAG: class I SAM-dependent methyltransferase [Acidobacteria bacterium]|nr:class I SAM-dependent methyltransferase [Acidobacteriota bacterium]